MGTVTSILKMDNFMGIKEESTEVLGKFLYFSLATVLVEREKLWDICDDLKLSIKPTTRSSTIDAFKSATGDIYKRIVTKENGNLNIAKIYCRDNQKSGEVYSRELIKETLGETTNRYKKLANIYFNKENENIDFTIDNFDSSLNVTGFCNQAEELYQLYKTCAGRSQIENLTDHLLDQMEALKISVHGKLFFIPKKNMHLLNLFEDFIEEINRNNKREGTLTVNSMFVIDDDKQRNKMTLEFYNSTKKEIEIYTEKLEHIIATNSQSYALMERWIQKIEGLESKKRNYEEIFKHELNDLDEQYHNLKFLADELSLRASKIKKSKCA